MTSEEESRQESSVEIEPEKATDLPQINPDPKMKPMQLLLQQIGKIGARQEELAKAMQHNDELLVDGVANLEMRVNLAMAIIHDMANGQVKFEGRDQHRRDNNGVVDVHWYYEQYMDALKKEQEEAEAKKVAEEKASEHPEGAVIFGGS